MFKNFEETLTFDDVMLVPKRSSISSRRDVDTSTYLTPNIKLQIPIVSANMDSVTEWKMAAALAKIGGIGVIHRFMSIEEQVAQVSRVKRMESLVIEDPYTLPKNTTLREAQEVMDIYETSILVTNKEGKLLGILTHRDILFQKDGNIPISRLMTKTKDLITASPNITMERAKKLLHKGRVEKLPLVDTEGRLVGLITGKDILKREAYPQATRDAKGRLRVGAAIGVKEGYLERAEALVRAGVDVLVVDIAHGHSKLAINTVKTVKKHLPKVDLIAGNVATGEGVQDLARAGADCVKIGVGPGAICITRIVAGSGVPQVSAIIDCAKAARRTKTPLIADGGIRTSGDITKALAAGAHTVMIGTLLAGTNEAPGISIMKDGKKYKISRGMAGYGANFARQEKEFGKRVDGDALDFVPEGVEGMVAYKGEAHELITQLIGGLRSGMSYSNAKSIPELQKNATFVRITPAGLSESKPHDLERL